MDKRPSGSCPGGEFSRWETGSYPVGGCPVGSCPDRDLYNTGLHVGVTAALRHILCSNGNESGLSSIRAKQ